MTDKILSKLNVKTDDYSAKDAMKAVTEFLQTEPVNTIEILPTDILMRAAQKEELRSGLEKLDLILAEDESILETARGAGQEQSEETRTQAFLRMAFHYFRRQHTRLFLLMDSEREAAKVEEYFHEHYRGIELIDAAAASDDESEDDKIINRINGAEVDCVLSGLTSPRQEAFIGRVHGVLNARLWLGIGRENFVLPRENGFFGQLMGRFSRRAMGHWD